MNLNWFDDDYTQEDYENDLVNHYNITKEEAMNVINCIGVDNNRHKCISWKDETLCGKPILKKGDNENYTKYPYHCFECDY